MTNHLAKAKEAVEAMRTYEPQDLAYGDLMAIAKLQALLAIGSALERLIPEERVDIEANPLAFSMAQP